MNEFVGQCQQCKKDLYCIDGFFNGIHTDEQQILCFECDKKEEKPAN
ncbi:hypothetical protein J2Z40_001875 [Cytobacillus eiseniae]|uniref:GapA-binding peptide SR1P n=1 Tax=Cytobacillus eiseniae TaxID=762947 RepID=A0ABS4REZ6_9BACI|nr:hypothetical protein [Cytobacillus eiseniae]MBP2241313.1 hypothetical protein [Cytobacillus eiseniae]